MYWENRQNALHEQIMNERNVAPLARVVETSGEGMQGARRWQASPLLARETQGQLAAPTRHLPAEHRSQAGIRKLAFLMPPP